MNKYGGNLIYQTRDEHGLIEVVDFKKVIRSLHFGNETQQSGMYLYNPVSLLHPYTQAMLSTIALQQPKRVLLLGIGGGSIIKFLLHNFPNVQVEAVDLRQTVIDVAHDYFDLPVNHRRLTIRVVDFKEYLKEAIELGHHYDLLMVDLFSTDNQGNIVVPLDNQISYMKTLLSENGILAINVLDGRIDALGCLEEVKNLFAGTLYEVPVDGANTIAMATRSLLKNSPSELEFQFFETRYTLPVRKFLKNMIKVA